jgi:hypothetical protein
MVAAAPTIEVRVSRLSGGPRRRRAPVSPPIEALGSRQGTGDGLVARRGGEGATSAAGGQQAAGGAGGAEDGKDRDKAEDGIAGEDHGVEDGRGSRAPPIARRVHKNKQTRIYLFIHK